MANLGKLFLVCCLIFSTIGVWHLKGKMSGTHQSMTYLNKKFNTLEAGQSQLGDWMWDNFGVETKTAYMMPTIYIKQEVPVTF
ncbi:MAG: hypothetical protein HRT61_10450 [Ekhidna sp.]|nr:hypothetical protein [Ekhidna sp.]